MRILQLTIMKIPCAGRDFTSSILFLPRDCETSEEMTLRVCPKTHINIDMKLPTIPTAPKEIVAFSDILPTIMVSVIDKTGSAIPEISAGIASF